MNLLINNRSAFSVYVQDIIIPIALLILIIVLIFMVVQLIKVLKSVEVSLKDVEHKLKELDGPVNTISNVDRIINGAVKNIGKYLKVFKK